MHSLFTIGFVSLLSLSSPAQDASSPRLSLDTATGAFELATPTSIGPLHMSGMLDERTTHVSVRLAGDVDVYTATLERVQGKTMMTAQFGELGTVVSELRPGDLAFVAVSSTVGFDVDVSETALGAAIQEAASDWQIEDPFGVTDSAAVMPLLGAFMARASSDFQAPAALIDNDCAFKAGLFLSICLSTCGPNPFCQITCAERAAMVYEICVATGAV